MEDKTFVTRRDTLKLAGVLGSAVVLPRELLNLSSDYSRIFSDEDLNASYPNRLYEDPVSTYTKLSISPDTKSSFAKLCETIGVSRDDLNGAQISWIAEQKHLEPDKFFIQRNSPYKETALVSLPDGKEFFIFYSPDKPTIVQEVSTIFPDSGASNYTEIYKGGVLIRSYFIEGKGFFNQVAIPQENAMAVSGHYYDVDQTIKIRPGKKIETALEITPEISDATNDHNTYFVSGDLHLVRYANEKGRLKIEILGEDQEKPLQFDSQLIRTEGNSPFPFVFRNLVGGLIFEEDESDKHKPTISFLVKSGENIIKHELKISPQKFAETNLKIKTRSLMLSGCTHSHKVFEYFENNQKIVDGQIPLSVLLCNFRDSLDSSLSFSEPWLFISTDGSGKIIIEENPMVVDKINRLPSSEWPYKDEETYEV